MRNLLWLILLIAGVVLAGYSAGLAVSLSRGEGIVDYSATRAGLPTQTEGLPGFHFVYDRATGEVTSVSNVSIVACVAYAPPESNLSILLEGSGVARVAVNVEGYGGGEATVALRGDAATVNVARFRERGIYFVTVLVSGDGVESLAFGGSSLYAGVAQRLPYSVVVSVFAGLAAAYAGLRLVRGVTAWILSYSLFPLIVFIVALAYGLARPFDGFSYCVVLTHVPQEWGAGRSYNLNKAIAAYVLGEVLGGPVSLLLAIMAGVASSLVAAGFMEAGLGEFESILYPSRKRNYAAKILLSIAVFATMPSLVILLGHILLYGGIPGGALYSSLLALLLTLGPISLVVSATMLVGLLSRRASAAIVAGVTLAVLPLLGFAETLSAGKLLDLFYHGTELSETTNDDLQSMSLSHLLAPLIEIVYPLITIGLIVSLLGYLAYSRWEP